MEGLARALLYVIVLCALAGGVLRLVLLKPWTIPDDPTLVASIAPTLDAGDLVLVTTRGTPGFGNLVRCKDPDDASAFVVGRIVGTSGDTVEIRGNTLFVNGTRYATEGGCPIPQTTLTHPVDGRTVTLLCGMEHLGGASHFRGTLKREAQTEVVTSDKRAEVPNGSVYLLSDNRDLHDDSRDFGPMPASACTERIVFRVVSRSGWKDDQNRLTVIR